MTTTATAVRANARKTTNEFRWADLSSSDDAAAAEFYAAVFGWAYDEMPLTAGMVHRNARLGGHMVAGIDPVLPGSDVPSAWTNFVFIEDIDATVSSARELGATVVMEPMDVMGEGHMAVLLDPAGAAFGLWQAGRHDGADAVNQPGAYTWVELATTDVEGAKRFYSDLFGWSWEQQRPADAGYWVASLDGGPGFAGVMTKPAEMESMPTPGSRSLG